MAVEETIISQIVKAIIYTKFLDNAFIRSLKTSEETVIIQIVKVIIYTEVFDRFTVEAAPSIHNPESSTKYYNRCNESGSVPSNSPDWIYIMNINTLPGGICYLTSYFLYFCLNFLFFPLEKLGLILTFLIEKKKKLKGLSHAEIIKKSVILFWLLRRDSWFLIIDNHVKKRKYRNFVSISSLTDEYAAEKLKNFCSSSLWTCLHHMVILRSQNKITDFLMILAWDSPFKIIISKMFHSCSSSLENMFHQ